MEEKKTELKMIKMSEVQSQEIEWLRYPFIPYGKLTIVQGDPGGGKTTLILNIAARLSKGEGLDSDMKLTEPMKIIYQTAEDGLADTVKPRLEKAGADCERIVVIDESDKSLSMADERLEEAIIQTGARMLILDPIQAYLGGGMDMNRANEARDMTKRLCCWWEPFFLLQEMNSSGAGDLIKKQINTGKLFIGESAGAILVAPNIEYARDTDNPLVAPNLKSFDALDIIDFYPVPHYNDESLMEGVEKIIAKYNTKLQLVPFSNSQAILVMGKEKQLVSNKDSEVAR